MSSKTLTSGVWRESAKRRKTCIEHVRVSSTPARLADEDCHWEVIG